MSGSMSPYDAEGTRPQRRYRTILSDSQRWDDFEKRPGDIMICTAYKSGTSWMQRICSLLVFGTAALDCTLDEISPWFDATLAPLGEVIARLRRQRHRRFVKSHSPLHALPYWEDVSYVYVGRDPRDVCVSLWHHLQVGDRLATEPAMARDFGLFFERWLTRPGVDGERSGWPYWSYFEHAASFWRARHRSNVHLVHFQSLLDDLEGGMRRLAGRLSITVDEAAWPELVHAARFETMCTDARLAAEARQGWWRDPSTFFRSGRSGQWRSHLDAERAAHYQRVARRRLPPDLFAWLHPETAEAHP